jgi:ParB family chromosome partitioning protein
MSETQTRKKGLGKGLGALLPQAQPAPPAGRTYFLAGIEEIRPNPWQPRKKVGAAAIEQLADSIRVNGIIQPLLVRKTSEGYELIAGERRWRAAQKAGLREVPVLVKETDPHLQLELALIENIQRKNLNPIEEAEAYRKLIDEFGLSQEEVARRVGKERSTVANFLRILRLPEAVQERILEGTISLGQAKCLLGFEDSQAQLDLASQIVEKQLSVRELERVIKKMAGGRPPKTLPAADQGEDWVKDLIRRLQTKIELKKGKKGGRIEIHFRTEEELIRLVDLLMASATRL